MLNLYDCAQKTRLAWRPRATTLACGLLVSACSLRTHSLGYNTTTLDLDASSVVDDGGQQSNTSTAGTDTGTDTGASTAYTASSLDGGGDTATNDTLDAPDSSAGPQLMDPPNVIVDVLGISPRQVDNHVEDVFNQLFFGDPSEQAVYFEQSDGTAYVLDVLHNDTRIDAIGYGMMATVQLDRRAEFDRLWLYAQQRFLYKDGPAAGYFRFTCALDSDQCDEVIDTFGAFYVITALFIAQQRWGSDASATYGEVARSLVHALHEKETDNGGIVGGVMNVFGDSYLPRSVPLQDEPEVVVPGSVIPAFFQLWAIASQDAYWQLAAERGRELLLAAPDPTTGLTPAVVNTAFAPTQTVPSFQEGSYGASFSLALDYSWVAADQASVAQVDKYLSFFVDQGLPSYPALYELNGTPLNENRSSALVALNGAAAGISTIDERAQFIRAVWEAPIPTGLFRYYDGMNQLMSLLYLSGKLRPYY